MNNQNTKLHENITIINTNISVTNIITIMKVILTETNKRYIIIL